MATPTFDMSGLVLLENSIQAMLAAPASDFIGGAVWTATFNSVPGGAPAQSMTTQALQARIKALHLNFDRLPL